MTEPQAIKLVKDYLINHKFLPERFNPDKLPQGQKSPDFKIVKDDQVSFYCEVKTPDLRKNERTNMFHWTTNISKIRNFIHKAVQQFEGQDPNHSKPWVLFFISSSMQLNWSNYQHAIQGKVTNGDQLIKELTEFVKKTDEDVVTIDLTIWCQVNGKDLKIGQLVPFINYGSPLITETKNIYKELVPYESEKIMDVNVKYYN